VGSIREIGLSPDYVNMQLLKLTAINSDTATLPPKYLRAVVNCDDKVCVDDGLTQNYWRGTGIHLKSP
jgi:hypothetical protein